MARYRNPDSEQNIKRIDSRRGSRRHTHGFQVYFKRDGVEYTKLFSDGVWGGKEDARDEARKFRAVLETKLGGPLLVVSHKSDSRSKLGKVGYSFTEHRNKDGSVAKYISASARFEKGKAKNIKIRIENDDIDSALKTAEKWRMEILNERLARERKGG